jgi:CelD/BcsL family acetyltransferase involved in cellulose biosynthesis
VLVETVKNLSSITHEWQELLDRSSDPSPYRGPDWTLNWAKHYQISPEKAMAITVRKDDRLVGLAPLMRTRVRTPFTLEIIESLGGRQSSAGDRLGFLTEAGQEAEVTSLLIKQLLEESWDGLDLRNIVAPRDGSAHPLLQAAQDLKLKTMVLEKMGSPFVTLECSAEAQRKKLTRNTKNHVNQHQNQLKRQGQVAFKHLTGEDSLPTLSTVFQLHKERRGDQSYWSGHQEKAFLPETLFKLLASKQASTHLLELNDQAIAGMVCLDDAQKRSVVMTGFNPDFGSFSPQSLLVWDTIVRSGQEGLQEFHLGKKDTYAKKRWGGEDCPSDSVERHLVYRDNPKSRYLKAVLMLGEKARTDLDSVLKPHRGFLVRHRDFIKPLIPLV